jgi:hypothetical protein
MILVVTLTQPKYIIEFRKRKEMGVQGGDMSCGTRDVNFPSLPSPYSSYGLYVHSLFYSKLVASSGRKNYIVYLFSFIRILF